MAKSKAVQVDVTAIGDNYKHVKYTYVYIDGEDAKRPISRDNNCLKGYKMMGKPKFKSIPFPDNTGGFWIAEMIYERI